MKKILTTLLFISTSVFANNSLYEIEIKTNDVEKKEESVVKLSVLSSDRKQSLGYRYENTLTEQYISGITYENNTKEYELEKIKLGNILNLMVSDKYIEVFYDNTRKAGVVELLSKSKEEVEILKIPSYKNISTSQVLTLKDQAIDLIKEPNYQVTMTIKKIKE